MLYPMNDAARHPDDVAYKMCPSGETVSFAQLEERSNQAAHLFRSLGLGIGAHIAILMENNRQFLELCFAADRCGLYYTTISTRLAAAEIAFIIDNCEATLFITSAPMSELAEVLLNQMPQVEHRFIVAGEAPGYESIEEALKAQPKTPIADERQGLDMLYSSGTTGRPKGIKWPPLAQPPGEQTMLIKLLHSLYQYGPQTRYLSPAPLYHAAPLRHSMSVIKLGGTAYIMDRFDAEESLRLIESERINYSQWVPTMFVRMLKLDEQVRKQYDISSMQVAIHAAAPCPIAIKEQMLDWWGPIIYEYYAGTENNGFCSITSEEWFSHRGSVGRAMLGDIHICDDDGEEVAIGAQGLVYFANGHDFSYHNDPERTKQTRNQYGWSTLGDIGYVDSDGYLYLVDRTAFVIISGGVNIYPQEIEDVLIDHPEVIDVAVFGIPNEDFGEEVKAVVQPRNPNSADAELAAELIEYCRGRIARFKCPRSIDFEASLPRHPTGKLYKRLLKDRYTQQHTG